MNKFIPTTLALLVLSAGTSFAASITLTGIDSARFGNVNIRVDGTNQTFGAGVIKATYDGGPSMDLFCVDLFTNINLETYDSYTMAPRTERYEDRVAWLYLNYYNPSTINTTTLGIAFQLAIWDIVHDGGDGFSAGRIRSNSSTNAAVLTAANNFIALSVGQSSFGANIYINSRNNVPAQALIGGTRDVPPMSDTPEPATMALIGAGLVGIYWKRRRAC